MVAPQQVPEGWRAIAVGAAFATSADDGDTHEVNMMPMAGTLLMRLDGPINDGRRRAIHLRRHLVTSVWSDESTKDRSAENETVAE